jgi:hypothetical protein
MCTLTAGVMRTARRIRRWWSLIAASANLVQRKLCRSKRLETAADGYAVIHAVKRKLGFARMRALRTASVILGSRQSERPDQSLYHFA